MKTLCALAFLLAAGCDDDNKKLAAAELRDTSLETRLAALEAQVGALPTGEPMAWSLAGRLDVLEKAVSAIAVAKVPHLLAYARTDHEVDLGIGSPGSRCALNDSLEGEVCFGNGSASTVWFSEAHCNGNAAVEQTDTGPTGSALGLRRIGDGRVFSPEQDAVDMVPASYTDRSGACYEIDNAVRRALNRAVLRGRVAVIADQKDLSVDLR